MLKIDQLRVIVALAREGSMHKAAEELFISQPALSVSLKKIEDELGVLLFNRTTKGVLPTKIGSEVIEMAQNILEQVAQIHLTCNEFKLKSEKMDLKIYTTEFINSYLLANTMMLLRQYFRDISIMDSKNDILSAPQNMLKDSVYIAIEPEEKLTNLMPEFVAYPICTLDIGAMIKKDSFFAGKDKLNEKELLSYPFANLLTDINIFRDYRSYLLAKKQINVVFEADSPILISNYVSKHKAWCMALLVNNKNIKAPYFTTSSNTQVFKIKWKKPVEYKLAVISHQSVPAETLKMVMQLAKDSLLEVGE